MEEVGGCTPRKILKESALRPPSLRTRTGSSSLWALPSPNPLHSCGTVFRARDLGCRSCCEKGVSTFRPESEVPSTPHLPLSLPDLNPRAIHSRFKLKWFRPLMYLFKQHARSNYRIRVLPEGDRGDRASSLSLKSQDPRRKQLPGVGAVRGAGSCSRLQLHQKLPSQRLTPQLAGPPMTCRAGSTWGGRLGKRTL